MPATTEKPSYAARTQITISLDSLGNGNTVVSSAVDNSSSLYSDVQFELYIDGTAATGAWLDVRLYPSFDNTNFGTWESGIPLHTVDLSVDLQRAFFSFRQIGMTCPKYFKIAVRNNTDAALAASGNTLYMQGINMQGV